MLQWREGLARVQGNRLNVRVQFWELEFGRGILRRRFLMAMRGIKDGFELRSWHNFRLSLKEQNFRE
jgi:hypothetical protein